MSRSEAIKNQQSFMQIVGDCLGAYRQFTFESAPAHYMLHTLYGTVRVHVRGFTVTCMLIDAPQRKKSWYHFDGWKYVYRMDDYVQDFDDGWEEKAKQSLSQFLSLLYSPFKDDRRPNLLRSPPQSTTICLSLSVRHLPDRFGELGGTVVHELERGGFLFYLGDVFEGTFDTSRMALWFVPIFLTAKNLNAKWLVFTYNGVVDVRFKTYQGVADE